MRCRVVSHYFDWDVGREGRPYTDDPRFAGVLEGTPANRVTLDGVQIEVLRCQTGPDGWVEVIATDGDGRVTVGPDGEVVTSIRHGLVEFSMTEG